MEPARRRLLAAALLAPIAGRVSAQQELLANGIFLVAKPELPDPNFRETVVLITQPDVGSGPLGVIINRPLAARLSDAFPTGVTIPAGAEQIYGGGPVARNRMLFLVRANVSPPRSLRILDDLFLSGDPQLPVRVAGDELKVLAYRAYIGYAGWGPRQLQSEIAAGGWYLGPVDTDTIFTADASTVWPAMIKRVTSQTT